MNRSAVNATSRSTIRRPISQLFRMASRDGLGEYLISPESFPPSRVISYDEKFVSIYDKYPKASIHALLLPRDPAWNLLHPFEALKDPSFLAEVKEHANSLKASVAGELKRRYGGKEAAERDWLNEVKVGVHAHPSMSHLHIHIISVDNFSVSMKTRKHYSRNPRDLSVSVISDIFVQIHSIHPSLFLWMTSLCPPMTPAFILEREGISVSGFVVGSVAKSSVLGIVCRS